MDTELFKEWFQAFAQLGGLTLHVENQYGENNHHIVETCFKGTRPRVAIIDYGSGNLRSAAKAFERAAREAGTDDRVPSPPPSGCAAPTASCCRASAPSPIAAPASTPCPAWSRR
jgi:hypothetical protein